MGSNAALANSVQCSWTKSAIGLLSSRMGPLLLKVEPKGDGRWSWQVFNGDAQNPMATGVASSLGAAKTVTEQFARRSGLV